MLWTSVKTLAMHLVVPHGHSNPFSRSNEPQRDHTPRPLFRRFSCAITNHFLGDPDSIVKKANIFCGNPSRPWICIRLALTDNPTLFQENHFLGDSHSNVKNDKKFCVRPSRHWICSWLALTANPTHFKGQMSPKARFAITANPIHFQGQMSPEERIPPILTIFTWLCIRMALTTSSTHFRGQTSPVARIPLISMIFVIRILMSKMPKILVDFRQDLGYASGWPSRPIHPIFKVKRAANPDWTSCPIRPIFQVKRASKRVNPPFQIFLSAIANHFLGDQDSDIKNAKKICRCPSIPWLCSQLSLTASSTYFQGQTSPKARIPSILMVFVCYSKLFLGQSHPFLRSNEPEAFIPLISMISKCYANHFLGDPYSIVKNAKKFCGRLSRPCLCSQYALKANLTHFQGQTSPEARIPPISISSNHFLGDSYFDVKNAKNFGGLPSRPWLCIRLALKTYPPHFQGQMSRKACIPQFRLFSCAIASHFLGDSDSDIKIPKIFMEVRQNFYYEADRPSRLVQPIFMVKQSPKRAYPHFNDFHMLSKTIFWVIQIPTSKMPKQKNSTSIKTLAMKPVKRVLERAYPPFQRFSCAIANHFLGDSNSNVKNAKKIVNILKTLSMQPKTIFWVIRILTSKMQKKIMDVPQDLCYASGCPSQSVRPIFKVKQAPNRLALTAIPTNFQGQPSPAVHIPPTLTIFECYSTPFFGDPDSNVKNDKKFCPIVLLSNPTHYQLQMSPGATLAMQPVGPHGQSTHFHGQTIPKARMPPISMSFVCYNKPFFGKPFVKVLQDPGYASGWPSRPIRPILNVKRAPKRAYPPFR
uniref:Uncharacterized protein n=1 Tax=Solanum lycopersicum TaxID=4081 RepID=A0A3Q7FNK7_SOLLC